MERGKQNKNCIKNAPSTSKPVLECSFRGKMRSFLIAYHYSVFVSGAIVDKANCLCCIVLRWFVCALEWVKCWGGEGMMQHQTSDRNNYEFIMRSNRKQELSSTRMWYICSKRRITCNYVRGLAPIRGSCLILLCI